MAADLVGLCRRCPSLPRSAWCDPCPFKLVAVDGAFRVFGASLAHVRRPWRSAHHRPSAVARHYIQFCGQGRVPARAPEPRGPSSSNNEWDAAISDWTRDYAKGIVRQ